MRIGATRSAAVEFAPAVGAVRRGVRRGGPFFALLGGGSVPIAEVRCLMHISPEQTSDSQIRPILRGSERDGWEPHLKQFASEVFHARRLLDRASGYDLSWFNTRSQTVTAPSAFTTPYQKQ